MQQIFCSRHFYVIALLWVSGLCGLATTTQAQCTTNFPALSMILSRDGQPVTLGITATVSDCRWTVTSNAAWMAITSAASGLGSGSITITVTANATTTPRIGKLLMGNKTLYVEQAGTLPRNTEPASDANPVRYWSITWLPPTPIARSWKIPI